MARNHTAALVALATTVTAFSTKTFVTRAPKGTEAPYVILHPAQGSNSADRLTGPSATKHPRFTGHIVGETADQVQLLADLLEAAIFPDGRGVITVAGETVKNFWYESPLPIQVSIDPLPEVIFAIVECGWAADPA